MSSHERLDERCREILSVLIPEHQEDLTAWMEEEKVLAVKGAVTTALKKQKAGYQERVTRIRSEADGCLSGAMVLAVIVGLVFGVGLRDCDRGITESDNALACYPYASREVEEACECALPEGVGWAPCPEKELQVVEEPSTDKTELVSDEELERQRAAFNRKLPPEFRTSKSSEAQ